MTKCKYCKKSGSFNFKGIKNEVFCKDHEIDGMENVINEMCTCGNRASFNYKGLTKALYCSKCAKNEEKRTNKEMFNIKLKYCENENCEKQALYGEKGTKKVIFCKEHKKTDMKNLKHKMCRKCFEKHPIFNYPDKKEYLYCEDCAEPGMVNVKDPMCIKCNKTRPTFNIKGKKKEYCKICATPDMIDVTHNLCIQCNETRADNQKYKKHCLRCFMYLFPDEPITKNFKLKEKHVMDFIKDNFPNEKMTFDKIIGGCSRRRPDCFIEKEEYIIVIECDENQHQDYSCENKRIMEISQDVAHRPVIFIRFNPDSYKDEFGKTKHSCFKNHKTLGIDIKSKKEWNHRIALLKSRIDYHLNTDTLERKTIDIEYLFFTKTDESTSIYLY